MGALVGFLGSLVIDLLAMSFCEFFAMEEQYATIASDISAFATILGAFIGFICAIDEERK